VCPFAERHSEVEGKGCCRLLSFTYFHHGKSIQVVADGTSVITLPGFKLVLLTCQGSTGIGPVFIPPVRAVQKRMKLLKGKLLLKEHLVLIPDCPCISFQAH